MEFLELNKQIKEATNKVTLKESSLSRLYKHAQEHDSGTISAFRYARECGEGEVFSIKDNRKNNSILKSKLLKLGHGVTPIKGTYIENYGSDRAREVLEDSFFVVDLKDSGNLKDDLIKLGTLFEQDSITYSKPNGDYFLISTNKCPDGHPGYGTIGKEIKLGKPIFGKDGEFHSKIRGRPFVFESQDYKQLRTLTDLSISEIRSVTFIANESIV